MAAAQFLARAARALAEAGPGLASVLDVLRTLADQLIGADVLAGACTIQLRSADGAALVPAISAHRDPAARAALQAAQDQPPVQSEGTAPGLLIVPVRAAGRMLGTLSLARASAARPYTHDEQALVEALACQAGLALAAALQHQELEHEREQLQSVQQQSQAAQAAAEAERKRLHAVLAQSPAALSFVSGPDLIIELAHPSTLPRSFDRPLGAEDVPNVVGKSLIEVVSDPRHHGYLEQIQRVYRTGQPVEGKAALVKQDNPVTGTVEDTYWDYAYLPTRDAEGNVDGVMTFVMDVTAHVLTLRRAEAARDALEQLSRRLELAIEATAFGIWDFDVHTNTLAWDARSRQIFGLGPDDPVSYDIFLSRLHPEDREHIHRESQQAMDPTGTATVSSEYRVILPGSGLERWVSSRGRAMFDAHGKATRVTGTLIDITERKQAEAERARLLAQEQTLRHQAEAASRAKDEFLAMLGHELRNPLSPILTALELMRLQRSDVLVRERTIIERQVDHLIRLVEDLLDISRITRGRIELKRRSVEISEVVVKAIEMASPLIEKKHHQLVTVLPRVDVLVHADEHRLSQIIANLLTNAAKYTEPGGRIEVVVRPQSDMVELRVRDSGTGIDPELLPQLFEPFVQGKQDLARSQSGLGLGLAIVRSLTELHGGTVTARSQGRGQGSEFTIRLPRAPQASGQLGALVHAQTGAVQASLQASLSGQGPGLGRPARPLAVAAQGQRLRVLIVDDNQDAADLLSTALQHHGYEIQVAYDGPRALDVAARFAPQIGLLDLGLPVMDGFELARRLRAAHGAILLVAITGYGHASDRARAREAGFHEHLIKPVDAEQVHTTITRLLDSQLRAAQPAPTARGQVPGQE